MLLLPIDPGCHSIKGTLAGYAIIPAAPEVRQHGTIKGAANEPRTPRVYSQLFSTWSSTHPTDPYHKLGSRIRARPRLVFPVWAMNVDVTAWFLGVSAHLVQGKRWRAEKIETNTKVMDSFSLHIGSSPRFEQIKEIDTCNLLFQWRKHRREKVNLIHIQTSHDLF